MRSRSPIGLGRLLVLPPSEPCLPRIFRGSAASGEAGTGKPGEGELTTTASDEVLDVDAALKLLECRAMTGADCCCC